MQKVKLILLAILLGISMQTKTSIPDRFEREFTGKLIHVGPTPRLMYEFTPKQWQSLGLELQLKQIRLDSICYTQDWLGYTRKYYKQRYWEEAIKNGTEESKAWGIKPGADTYRSAILDFVPVLRDNDVEE